MQADRGAFGNFSTFADTPDAFDCPDVALLNELAADRAFGIQTRRARAAEAQKVRRLSSDAERKKGSRNVCRLGCLTRTWTPP